jgi:hypothetical protein
VQGKLPTSNCFEQLFSRLHALRNSQLASGFAKMKETSCLLGTVVVRFDPSHHRFRYKDSEFLDSELLEVNWHHRLYLIGLTRVAKVLRQAVRRLYRPLIGKA